VTLVVICKHKSLNKKIKKNIQKPPILGLLV